jgi:hypothetical protein
MDLMLNMKDISKDTLQMQKKVKKPPFLQKHVSLFFASVVSPEGVQYIWTNS